MGLALIVFLLGGAVLWLKLRPTPVPESQTNTKIVLWKKQIDANGDDSWNWTGLGLAYLDARRNEDALDAFEKAIELDPGNWLANLQTGQLILADNPDRARKLFEDAAAVAPPDNKATIYVSLGDLLYAKGDYKKARIAYAKGVAIVPSVFELRMGLGRSLQALGDRKGALTQYEEALRVNPGSELARFAIDNVREPVAPSQTPSASPAA